MFGFAFAVVSPVILPVAWCFFLTAFVTYRYALLYVFERSYESGRSCFGNRTSHPYLVTTCLCMCTRTTRQLLAACWSSSVVARCTRISVHTVRQSANRSRIRSRSCKVLLPPGTPSFPQAATCRLCAAARMQRVCRTQLAPNPPTGTNEALCAGQPDTLRCVTYRTKTCACTVAWT